MEVIRVENIHKKLGHEEVLKGVSFSAKQGQVISIIGASGSGKSTLLRCLNLLEIPDEGKIFFQNQEVATHKNKKQIAVISDPKQLQLLRCHIGMVFQNFNLWEHKTVVENVSQAPILVLKIPPDQARQEAEAFLSQVGLEKQSHKYPAQLSGGQKQRVGIARALAMKPDLLLFDEPTSALDPEMVMEVLTIMDTLSKEGRTMILVTHEIDFAYRISDNIIFLKDGKIVEEGKDIIKNPKTDSLQHFLSPS